MNIKKIITVVFTATVLSWLTIPASAVPITVLNQSFENPFTSGSTGIAPDNWGLTGSGGVFKPSGNLSFGAGFIAGVEGDQTAFSNGGDFSQTLSTALQIGTYTLTVALGDRADTILPSQTIKLLAGLTLIASTTTAASVISDGWTNVSASVTINAGNLLIGSFLKIELVNNGGEQANWDNVRLDRSDIAVGVVPLPAALPLYGSGLAIMGFIGWRRKRKATL